MVFPDCFLSRIHPPLICFHVSIGARRISRPRRVPVLRSLVKPQPQRSANHQRLHDERGAVPRHGILQRDEPHEVIPELRVVPGAGVELAQQKARPELPHVRPQRVDEAAEQDRAAVSQREVHPLHDQDARPVDE